jgi:hypothetical protein
VPAPAAGGREKGRLVNKGADARGSARDHDGITICDMTTTKDTFVHHIFGVSKPQFGDTHATHENNIYQSIARIVRTDH